MTKQNLRIFTIGYEGVTMDDFIALLCFERDPAHCHRTILLEGIASNCEIIDLFA